MNQMSAMTWEHLKTMIKEYESDTFSFSASKPTDQEVEGMAERVVSLLVDRHLDGLILSDALEDQREENE